MIFLFSFGFHFHFCVPYLEKEVWTHETHQTEKETVCNYTENELQPHLTNNWIRAMDYFSLISSQNGVHVLFMAVSHLNEYCHQ
jgi:hypothetical protein